LLVAGLICLPGLGERPLYSAGEVRGALIARAMVESGDWLTPHLNHVRYYEKPPLMYWSIAAAFRVFGVNEFASRLPFALAYMLTGMLVFLLGLEFLAPSGAWRAALIFLTVPAAFQSGRFVSIDALLTLFLTLSLYGLMRTLRLAPPSKTSPSLPAIIGPLCFWLGMALAGLTKGFIGLLFPLATAVLCALLNGSWRELGRLRPVMGAFILVFLFLPWHVLIAWRDPSFVKFYVLNEHIYRFLNIREPIDYAPLSIPAFALSAALWFFPWSLLGPGSFAWAVRQRPIPVPLIFALIVFGFFSFAQSRLEYYAHPTYPALAILVAGYWLTFQPGDRRWLGVGIPALLMMLLGLAVAYFGFVRPNFGAEITSLVAAFDGYYREYFGKHPDQTFFFAREALELAKPFAISWLLLGFTVFLAARARRFGAAFLLWVLCFLPSVFVFDSAMCMIAKDRSQRDASRLIKEHWQKGARLVVAGTYEDAGGVTFYTGFRTEMLGAHDGDLYFGYKKGDAPDLFLSESEFERLWNSQARVFLMMQAERRPPPQCFPLLETPRHRLLTNYRPDKEVSMK
jgi:4-amino-4-deoxy-L-arabinose transferase-like glycosyltransferase